MFKFLLKDKIINTIVDKISQEMNRTLTKFQDQHNQKFEQVLNHLESMRIELKSLDQRLSSKEVKDKMDYGHMQYKLSSLQTELKQSKPIKKKESRLDN